MIKFAKYKYSMHANFMLGLDGLHKVWEEAHRGCERHRQAAACPTLCAGRPWLARAGGLQQSTGARPRSVERPVQAHHWGSQRVPARVSHAPGRGPVRDRDRHAGHQKPPGPGYAAAGVSILGHAGGRPSALSVVHGEGALDDALGDNDHTVRLAWAASGLRQRR